MTRRICMRGLFEKCLEFCGWKIKTRPLGVNMSRCGQILIYLSNVNVHLVLTLVVPRLFCIILKMLVSDSAIISPSS